MSGETHRDVTFPLMDGPSLQLLSAVTLTLPPRRALRIVNPSALTHTDPALARTRFCLQGVHFIEWMPVFAMRLAGVPGGQTHASQHVRSRRDRFKVRGIHADPHAAQMIEFESLRNRSNDVFIRPAVCANVCPSRGKESITATHASRPKPARAEVGTMGRDRPGLVDFGPEPIWRRAALVRAVFRTETLVPIDRCEVHRTSLALSNGQSASLIRTLARTETPSAATCWQERSPTHFTGWAS